MSMLACIFANNLRVMTRPRPLPCDLFVRVSTGYIADASGRIIEGNGNEPEIKIEPTIDDAKQQVDGVLERAFLELEKRGKQ